MSSPDAATTVGLRHTPRLTSTPCISDPRPGPRPAGAAVRTDRCCASAPGGGDGGGGRDRGDVGGRCVAGAAGRGGGDKGRYAGYDGAARGSSSG